MNKTSIMNRLALGVVLLGGALLSRPAHATNTDAALLACTATQIAEIQQYIDNTCDGGGRVWVYCSWTGLWETRSAVECYD
jgi:hypothetical protein